MAVSIRFLALGTRVFDRWFSSDGALTQGAICAADRSRFVIRCATAASLAYELARLVGLQHPVWAPISALIVSQESVTATLDSIHGRFVGTFIGLAVALLVNSVGRKLGIPLVLQMGIGVALCASAAMGRPLIRVCLWTCPLILVAAATGPAPALVAVMRASEVVLGAVVGGVTHIVEERIGTATQAHTPDKAETDPDERSDP